MLSLSALSIQSPSENWRYICSEDFKPARNDETGRGEEKRI